MSLSNYRCFAKRQDIELRPITLVLGRNNSGKSALVRAPLVLSTGIHTESTAPLDLDRLGEELVESFTDLIYGGRPHGSLDIELEFDSGLQMAATVQNLAEYRTQVVSSFQGKSRHTPRNRLDWIPGDPTTGLQKYTLASAETEANERCLPFQGLLPVSDSQLLTLAQFVRNEFDTIRYLGPFRDRPARRDRLPTSRPLTIGTSGENTLRILANDAARNQGRLIRAINEELGESLPDWTLDVDESVGTFTVALQSKKDTSIRINLADTGTGVAQALPIFVQRALDLLDPPTRPVLEIVEQPELHLHPAAHGALADLYLRAARDANVRFLIETHSETLLLRLRRRIAEGELPSDHVSIYFVNNQNGVATARKITVDADGNLDYWPEGVFSEDYHETRQLAKAQLKRAGNSAN
jgi:hypothetical protein